MKNEPIEKLVCQRCTAVLDATDNYCRRCGEPTHDGLAVPNRSAASHWSESPAFVLPMLFLVVGPLAFPLLWRSRRFSLAWKAILTVVVLAVTVWVCWKIGVMFDEVFRQIQAVHF